MTKEKNEILNELKSVSPALAAIDRINVFSVPEGYFNDLPQTVSTSIFFDQNAKTQVNDIPDGYFDDLSNKILTKIKKNVTSSDAETEIRKISPLIHSLKEKNVFNIPSAYFELLSYRVVNKVKPERAKIISLYALKNWWKFAAAAMIAVFISIWALQFFNNKGADNDNIQLSATYAKSVPAYIQDAGRYNTPNELTRGIASLSDDEIASYLEHHGNIMDDYLLTKDVDTKELPEATDYLINENTLSNFLKQIDDPTSTENKQVK
ncbi:MAG: hypothetical protein ABI325_12030 [Ginsengibacter sp.]